MHTKVCCWSCKLALSWKTFVASFGIIICMCSKQLSTTPSSFCMCSTMDPTCNKFGSFSNMFPYSKFSYEPFSTIIFVCHCTIEFLFVLEFLNDLHENNIWTSRKNLQFFPYPNVCACIGNETQFHQTIFA